MLAKLFIIIDNDDVIVCNQLCASYSSTADKDKHGKKDDSSPFKVNVLGKKDQTRICQFESYPCWLITEREHKLVQQMVPTEPDGYIDHWM